MGDITKTLFGGSEQEQQSQQKSSSEQYTTFGVRKTPFSSLFGDTLTLDPSIRTLQEQALAGLGPIKARLSSGIDDFLSKQAGTRASLLGNSGMLREARLSPLRESIAMRRGELQQSTGLRGLSGSSFGEQAMSNFDMDSARQIGEASSLADADTLRAITGIDKDSLNAIIGKIQIEANLLGLPNEIAQQRLQQELAAFALGKGTYSKSESSGASSGSGWSETGVLPATGQFLQGVNSGNTP